MDFFFNQMIAKDYSSKPQRIRIMSEDWVEKNIFCPCCGNSQLRNLENNQPVADFVCPACNAVFELKSKQGKLGKKLVNGAYGTMIDRITSTQNPNLFVLNYTENLSVINMFFIPNFFFVPSMIEKRNPLASTARRAGWVGCNILINKIPTQGKINIIQNQQCFNAKKVVENYLNIKKLKTSNIENRGWLFDVLNCVNNISDKNFTLTDVYQYAENLQQKYTNNHNIQAKIRQQLQILRDKGIIEFVSRGYYRKID